MRSPFALLPFLALAACQSPAPPPLPEPAPPVKAAPIPIETPKTPQTTVTKTYRGKASYYSIRTNGGTATASGERLRNEAYTAAHRSLPFGTKVRVTNLRNGKTAVVRINDRGPFLKGRIIDVTIGVARSLGMIKAGVVPCKVEVLKKQS